MLMVNNIANARNYPISNNVKFEEVDATTQAECARPAD